MLVQVITADRRVGRTKFWKRDRIEVEMNNTEGAIAADMREGAAAVSCNTTSIEDKPLLTENLPDDALVNVRVVKALTGDPVDSTIWRWINAGDFPAPERRSGPRRTGGRLWQLGKVRKWLRGEWTSEAA